MFDAYPNRIQRWRTHRSDLREARVERTRAAQHGAATQIHAPHGPLSPARTDGPVMDIHVAPQS